MNVVDKVTNYVSVSLRPVYEGEPGSPDSMTEQVYIPLKVQVEQMLLSGRMLEAYRKELYHFGPDEEVDESFEDPTLHPSFDAADAAIERMRLLGKRERILREAEAAREKDDEEQMRLFEEEEKDGEGKVPGRKKAGEKSEPARKKEVRQISGEEQAKEVSE